MSLSEKKAVVTGSAGALGSAITKALLEAEAEVFGSYFNEREIEAIPQAVKEHPKLHLQKIDLSQEKEVQAWFNQINSPDILINAVGGFHMSPVQETSLQAWRHMHSINLTTVFLCCREALKAMTSKPYGRIINIGAFAVLSRTSGMAAYQTAKAGVIKLTETIAEETLETPITCNALLPSTMDTAVNRSAMPESDFSKWVPLARVADSILFLCEDNSWVITGATIPLRAHC